MDPKTLKRIERQLNSPGLAGRLSQLSPSDLQSLWLEVSRRVVAGKAAPSLLTHWSQNRFVRPSESAPQDFLAVAQHFYGVLPAGVEGLELSPVAPLGACSAVAMTHQHRIISAERGCEVMADPTNVLALEAASRRREILGRSARSTEQVSLATVQRVVRAQFLDRPGLVPHFSLAALCTAGRDRGTGVFELAALRAHFSIYVGWVQALNPDISVRIAVTQLGGGASADEMESAVFAPLRAINSHITCEFDASRQQGRAYYQTSCFKIYARFPGLAEFELADGGLTDWTAKLLSDRKERLLISGAGIERVVGAMRDSGSDRLPTSE